MQRAGRVVRSTVHILCSPIHVQPSVARVAVVLDSPHQPALLAGLGGNGPDADHLAECLAAEGTDLHVLCSRGHYLLGPTTRRGPTGLRGRHCAEIGTIG